MGDRTHVSSSISHDSGVISTSKRHMKTMAMILFWANIQTSGFSKRIFSLFLSWSSRSISDRDSQKTTRIARQLSCFRERNVSRVRSVFLVFFPFSIITAAHHVCNNDGRLVENLPLFLITAIRWKINWLFLLPRLAISTHLCCFARQVSRCFIWLTWFSIVEITRQSIFRLYVQSCKWVITFFLPLSVVATGIDDFEEKTGGTLTHLTLIPKLFTFKDIGKKKIADRI